MPPITIKDVAREAGVSVGSVSKVLNGLKVSQRLKLKVQAAIDRLGYEPNRLAQSMRRRSTDAIGCLVPDISNPLYGAILKAIDRRLQRAGTMLLLTGSADSGRTETDAIAEFKRRRVDGLILAPGKERDQERIEALDRFSAPIVILGRAFPDRFYSVRVDYRSGVRAATEYLIDIGHRRIALLTPLIDLWPGRERIEGFRAAFADAGIDPSNALIRPQSLSLDAAADAGQLLDSENPPTALILLGTRIMAGALKAMHDRRLETPKDISILSIGDPDWAAAHTPPITTLRWDTDEVARSVVHQLQFQLGRELPAPPRQIYIPTELILRGSCSRPAGTVIGA